MVPRGTHRKDEAISTPSSTPSIARSTAIMSSATALSRVTGFVRMWATGFALGVSVVTSSYYTANNIPNMIFELVAGGILSSLFIPTFLELKANRGEEAAWRFASHVFNLTALAMGVVAVIGTIWPEPFIWTQTFRMSGPDAVVVRETAEFLFRFFAIQVVAYGTGMVIQGLLNAHRRYVWPSLGPVFNNLVVIATMFVYVAIVPEDPERALVVLAVGTTLGVLTMFAVMLPDVRRLNWRYSLELGLSDPAVRRMLVLAVPTLVYVATNLVAVSFRNASAFAVSPDGPSQLMYAWTFFQLPYGILAVALATAVFTELADSAGRADYDKLRAQFGHGLRVTGALMLPAAALLIGLAEPLVTLYRVGAFKAEDVPAVAAALRIWAVGLLFYACMMFVLRTFYSMKDTRTPMLANLALTPVQIGLYVVLSTGVASWEGLGLNGIPIADCVFWSALFVTLAVLLRRRVGEYALLEALGAFARMALASAAGGLVAWWLTGFIDTGLTAPVEALLTIAVAASVGLVVMFAAGRLLKVPELDAALELGGRLVRRMRRKDR